MGKLEGKVAIVTGGASGIGLAAVQAFAKEGAQVIVADLDVDTANDVAVSVGGVAVSGNVSETATWDAIVAAAQERGGLDVAYLNAGVYGYTGPIEDLPLDVYERTVAANIGGVVLGTRAVVPAMKQRGGGAIVVTASVAGIVPFSLNPLYTLTKQAVTGFITALAPNLVADGITLNAVCPGVVDTPMTEGALGGFDASELGFDLIAPETIAAVALDLATTEGTGRSIAVLPGRDPISWSFPTWPDLANAT